MADEPNADESERAPPASAAKRFAPLAVIVVGLGVGYAFGLHDYLTFEALVENRNALMTHVRENFFFACAAYFVVYVAGVAFSFPAASLLTILSGFLFGWVVGGTLTVLAATIGASIIFLAARTALGDFLQRKAGPGVARLAHSFEDNAFEALLILRLAPVFPFFVVNVAPALFKVPLRTYIAATALGIVPGTYVYSYLGVGIDSVIDSVAAQGRDVALSDLVTTQIVAGFAALAAVAVVALIVRKLRTGRQT